MNVIEKAVHAHFEFLQNNPLPQSSTPGAPSQTNGVNGAHSTSQAPQILDAPFAKVNTVVGDSPAAQAGLKPQDLRSEERRVGKECPV